MPYVFSVINLKGGVGKTTTTVALAESLAVHHQKRVLVIDVDPQTNATVVLIGEKRWKALNDERATIAQLFDDALKGAADLEFLCHPDHSRYAVDLRDTTNSEPRETFR